MLDELNLPLDQVIILTVVTLTIAIYLWRHLGYFQLDTETKSERVDKYTKEELNPCYGAYIQLGMRRSN
ncbi:hypothetical protein AB1I63_04160 [Streptococcus pneumoniae]